MSVPSPSQDAACVQLTSWWSQHEIFGHCLPKTHRQSTAVGNEMKWHTGPRQGRGNQRAEPMCPGPRHGCSGLTRPLPGDAAWGQRTWHGVYLCEIAWGSCKNDLRHLAFRDYPLRKNITQLLFSFSFSVGIQNNAPLNHRKPQNSVLFLDKNIKKMKRNAREEMMEMDYDFEKLKLRPES